MKKIYKGLWLLMFLTVLTMFSSIVMAETFDGDTVYINDSKAYISATPHTIEGNGEPVIIEWTAKQYSGDINIIFGYNGEYIKPYKLQRYNPQEECYGEIGNQTCYIVEWTDIATNNIDFIKRSFTYDNKNVWYIFPEINVNAGQTYKYRVWFDVPYLTEGRTQQEQYPDYDGKYDIAFYPSNYGLTITGLQEAINNEHLYLLDPDVDLTADLEAYYKFDTDADDSVNSYDGVVSGATLTTGSGGIINEGYAFDVNNDFITFTGLDKDDLFGFSGWIYLDSLSQQVYVHKSAGYCWLKINTDGSLTGTTYDTADRSFSTGAGKISTGAWYHIVENIDTANNQREIWINNVLEINSSTSVGSLGVIADWVVGVDYTESLDGYYDEVAIYNKVLSPDDVAGLYNNGTAGLQYPFVVAGTPFLITAKNLYDDSSLTVFNATIDGTPYATTNGTIASGLLQNSSILHNVTIIAEDYFDEVNFGLNVSSDYEGTLFQTEISFSCYEYISETGLTCVNGTIYPNAGTFDYEIGVTEGGYYDSYREITLAALDNRTLRFNFTNSNIEIYAEDTYYNTTINDFSINLINSYYSFSDFITVSGDTYDKNLSLGHNYTFDFSKDGYTNASYTINNFTTQNYTFSVYQDNSILINIYKESDSTRITELINMQLTDSDSNITNNETSTGQIFLTNLIIGSYTIDFTSSNYSTRTYTFNITDDTTQTLNAYLISAGDSSQTIFTFQDKNTGSTVEGVGLVIQKIINGSYQVVESLISDITGRIGFNYVSNEPYRFLTSHENYISKNFTLNPILFDNYVINLETDYDDIDDTDYAGVIISFTPKKYYNEQNHTIEFIFGSPARDFVSYGFTATYNGTTIEDNGTAARGGILSGTIEILGAEFQDKIRINYYYELIDGTLKTFTRDYIIIGSDTNGSFLDSLGEHYGLGIFERIFFVTILVLLVAGGAAYYAGAVAAGTIAAFLFGFFAYTGFIPLWTVAISLVSFFIILTWRSSQ